MDKWYTSQTPEPRAQCRRCWRSNGHKVHAGLWLRKAFTPTYHIPTDDQHASTFCGIGVLASSWGEE